MLKRLAQVLNLYFLLPFVIWMAAGGVMWAVMSKQALFAMFNGHHNNITDTLMYDATWMGQGQVIVPLLVMMMAFPAFRNWWYFLTALLCNIAPFVVAQIIKSWLDWPRPLNLYSHASWIHYSKDWPELLYRSFPSGHSEAAFSMFCFLSLLLMPEYRRYGLLFFLLALAVAYSRMYLAAHFFSDVYAGSILGTVITTTVYLIMLRYKERMIKPRDTI